ncbi:membrane protein [Vibrio tubiashii]|nr:membrane protein [Vibrio tubiashii]
MRYAIEQYDKHGFLKAPKLVWLAWLFLAKAWVVFVVAGASRDSGSKILQIVYPDHTMLYLGLAMGIPSILLMWMVSLRSPERSWLNKIVTYGRGITLVTATAQLSQTLYHIYLVHGAFSWANGAVMLLLLWLIIYFVKSRSVKDCFQNVPTT